MARADKYLAVFVLTLALLVALVSWVFLPPAKEGDLFRHPSSFFNTGYGVKAAYVVLDESLGYDMMRLRRPVTQDTLEPLTGLMILEPAVEVGELDRSVLLEWVHAGGTLVVAPGNATDCDRKDSEDDEQNKWFLLYKPPTKDSPDDQIVKARRDDGVDSTDPLCAGINELATRRNTRFDIDQPLLGSLADDSWQPFWKDSDGLVGMRVGHGRGVIIALSECYPLTNLGLKNVDNALLLANLGRELAGPDREGVIAIDEFHHGFAARDASWLAIAKLTLTEYWGVAVLQLILAGALALYAAAVRFGKPQGVVQRKRRRHGEFATSAGRLLADARANRLALETLFEHYRDRLCATTHVDRAESDEALAVALTGRGDADVTALLSQTRKELQHGYIRQSKLLELANRLHDAVEEAEHGR